MYTENELNDLLAQVQAEFGPFLAKSEAEALLAKSEDGDDKKKPEPKKEEKPAEGAPPKADGPPAAAAEGEKAEGEAEKADGEEKVADGEKAQAEGAADGVPPPAEGAQDPAACSGPDCDYDAEDQAHMAEMYGSMSPGELKAHHDAVRQALDAQGGAQAGAPPAMPAAEGAPVAPPAEMDKCGEMGMQKSEKGIEVPLEAMVPAAQLEITKSELAASKTEAAELKKSNDVMKEFIAKLFDKKKAPAGKAITDLAVLEKSEAGKQEVVLSKGEITKILSAKTNNPTLAKSDRDAITAYYTGGQVNLEKIRHLLK